MSSFHVSIIGHYHYTFCKVYIFKHKIELQNNIEDKEI